MAKLQLSTKKLAIDKANTQMVAVVCVASVVTVFCLIAAQALWSQGNYQRRVVNAKNKAVAQLKVNVGTANQLATAYKAFVSTPQNAIGGNPHGNGPNDGNNATLVLDALPGQYDFPALASSLEKILTDKNLNIDSIGGTDDELAQQGNVSSPNPQPAEIPFSFSVSGANYGSVQNLIKTLQQSIRPFVIDSMTLVGGGNNMQLTVNAHTYYQPEKDLKIRTEVIQ